jgi:hypothetical protein
MVSIIDALGKYKEDPLPADYIRSLALAVRSLVVYLRSTLNGSKLQYSDSFTNQKHLFLLISNTGCRERTTVSRLETVTLTPSRSRGRPQKVISKVYLKDAMGSGQNIPSTCIARALGVHRNTIRHYARLYKIQRPKFSSISDSDLDVIIKDFKL